MQWATDKHNYVNMINYQVNIRIKTQKNKTYKPKTQKKFRQIPEST